MESVRIVAEMDIKPEDLESARLLLKELAAASRAEAGNISYIVTEDIKRPGHILILEDWKSRDAINEHNNTSHFQNFQKAIAPSVLKNSVTTLRRLF